MYTVVFNLIGSSISRKDEADALRFAYLVSDSLDALGSAEALFREEAAIRAADLKSRAAMLEAWMLPHFREKPEEMQALLRDFPRHISRRESRSSGDRRIQKSLENFFDALYNAYHDIYFDNKEALQLVQLYDLLDEAFFGAAFVDAEDPESDSEGEPASALLRLTLDENEGLETVYCLPAPLLHTKTAWSPGRLLRIPGLRDCSPEDLRRLRADCRGAGSAFAVAMEAWIKAPGNRLPEALTLAASELQALLERHPLLQKAESGLEVYGGTLPIADMWAGLRELGALPDPTWARLEQELHGAAKAVPTLLTQASGLSPIRTLSAEEALRTRKKSIIID